MQTHTYIPDVSSLQLCFFFRRLVHTLSFPSVLVPHVWLMYLISHLCAHISFTTLSPHSLSSPLVTQPSPTPTREHFPPPSLLSPSIFYSKCAPNQSNDGVEYKSAL